MKALPLVVTAGFVLGILSTSCDTSPDNSNPPSATAIATHSAKPLMVTVHTEGCPDQKLGGCWLPLGKEPTQKAVKAPHPINMRVGPGSTCDGVNEAHCWPQPGDTLEAICQTVGRDGQIWFRFKIPPKRVLQGNSTTGYARAEYFSTPENFPSDC